MECAAIFDIVRLRKLAPQADCRTALAAPVDDRLFFAGEACSEGDYSTAHGAYLTGIAAADRAIAARRS